MDGVRSIFVSWSASSEDAPFCEKIVRDLRSSLGEPSLVWYDLSGDEEWSLVIQELTARPLFLVVLSPDATVSKRVEAEFDLAWKQSQSEAEKAIIPILYRPTTTRPDLELLQQVSFVPPISYDVAFAHLLTAISKASAPGAHLFRSSREAERHKDHALMASKQMETSDSSTVLTRRRFFALSLVAIGLAGLSAGVYAIVESQHGSNPTGASVVKVPNGPRAQWQTRMNSSIMAELAADAHMLYVPTQDGALTALELRTGERIWSYHPSPGSDTSSPFFTTPAIANGVVFASWGDRWLYAIDATQGKVLWQFESRTPSTFSTPVITDGLIYLASADNYLAYALSVQAKSMSAQFSSGGSAHVATITPAVANGSLDIATSDGMLYAFDVLTRHLRWTYPVSTGSLTAPVAAGGFVYVGTQDGHVVAIHQQSGQFGWDFLAGEYVRTKPTVLNGALYLGSGQGDVYALDAATGIQRWKYRVNAAAGSTPALTSGRLYFTADDFALYALDAHTGSPLWRSQVSNTLLTSPLIVSGTAYIGSDDGMVSAFPLGE